MGVFWTVAPWGNCLGKIDVAGGRGLMEALNAWEDAPNLPEVRVLERSKKGDEDAGGCCRWPDAEEICVAL